jgi:cytoskeletal protein CcmA (bactofilin family)
MVSLPEKDRQVPKEALIIGEGVCIQGKVSTAGSIVLNGRIEGEVRAGEILVGPTGCIVGTLVADNADICGQISENIVVRKDLILRETASALGSVCYGALKIELGAQLNASVSIYESRGTRPAGEPIVHAQPDRFDEIETATSGNDFDPADEIAV